MQVVEYAIYDMFKDLDMYWNFPLFLVNYKY